MKYDDIIEAIKDSIKYKKLMADAGGGGGGAGAGGGAAGGSGGASAGGSATGTSGDGGSAEGGGSSATPSADSTSSEPTSQRGGYFAGYGGYWASKGSSKKKKKKKSKVGSVKDGIYEGDVIDFKQKQTKGDRFAIHIYTTDHTGRFDWISGNKYRNQYEASRHVQFQLDRGVKPEHIKVNFNGKFINMPEFGITESIASKIASVGILTALLGAGASQFLNKLPDQQAQPTSTNISTTQSYHQGIKDRVRSQSDRAVEIAQEMGIIKNQNDGYKIKFSSVGGVPVEINGIEVPIKFLTDKEIEKIKQVEEVGAWIRDGFESTQSLPESATVEQLEDKKYELEGALSRAREITRDIKYVDTHVEIVSKLGTLAEDVGLELDDYNERQVYAAKNKLESAIYELEEVFEDAIRDISNKIDELEYED